MCIVYIINHCNELSFFMFYMNYNDQACLSMKSMSSVLTIKSLWHLITIKNYKLALYLNQDEENVVVFEKLKGKKWSHFLRTQEHSTLGRCVGFLIFDQPPDWWLWCWAHSPDLAIAPEPKSNVFHRLRIWSQNHWHTRTAPPVTYSSILGKFWGTSLGHPPLVALELSTFGMLTVHTVWSNRKL